MQRLLGVNNRLKKQTLVSQLTMIYQINMVYILARKASYNINIKAPDSNLSENFSRNILGLLNTGMVAGFKSSKVA